MRNISAPQASFTRPWLLPVSATALLFWASCSFPDYGFLPEGYGAVGGAGGGAGSADGASTDRVGGGGSSGTRPGQSGASNAGAPPSPGGSADSAQSAAGTAGSAQQAGPSGSPSGPSTLVINEVDYDQPGPDDEEFIELYNAGDAAADLTNLALVFVNGSKSISAEYARLELSGILAPGAYFVAAAPTVAVDPRATSIPLPFGIQNGSPDGIALINTANNAIIDALSYEGAIRACTIVNAPGTYDLVEGRPTNAQDSESPAGSVIRTPNGNDTNNAATDWGQSSTPTPGAANR